MEWRRWWTTAVSVRNGIPGRARPISVRKISTFNIAPTWTHLVSSNTVFTLGGFVRQDQYNYYPSGNPFADLSPSDLQQETIGQNRTLTNAGCAPMFPT